MKDASLALNIQLLQSWIMLVGLLPPVAPVVIHIWLFQSRLVLSCSLILIIPSFFWSGYCIDVNRRKYPHLILFSLADYLIIMIYGLSWN